MAEAAMASALRFPEKNIICNSKEKTPLMAEVAVAFALLNLSQVLREPLIKVSKKIRGFYEDIEWLHMELRKYELFLRFADKEIWVAEKAYIWLAHTRDVANKAETIAAKFAFIRDKEMQNDGRRIWKSYAPEAKVCRSLLHDIKMELKELKSLISKIEYPSSHENGVEEAGKPLLSSPSPLNAVGKHSKSDILIDEGFWAVAMFEAQIDSLKKQLYSDKLRLYVVGVVGMGGVGKTTLASQVFKSVDVQLFPIRVWVDLSQNYIELRGIESLLREIARQTNHQTEDLKGKSTRELSELVERNLKGKRYLIVMDDMWEEEVWDLIEEHLPDESNGSRIVITTRNGNVAQRPAFHFSLCKLQFLNREQSWDLFIKLMFGNEEGLNWKGIDELRQIAEKLVDKCGGSPLALDCLVDSLAGKDKTPHAWESALENEEWQKRCADTLKLSYTCLPIHLKWCFLYLSAFPEDSKIEVERLIRLWVAEGFIKTEDHENYNYEEKTWEDIAEGYLEDLKQRCLVIVEDAIQASEFVSFCYIPKILRALGINEAKETGFMDGLSCFSISSQPNLTFTEMWMRFEEVIWLRVLDLQGLDIGDLPEQVGDMAQLRYLNVRSSRCKLPDSICRLSKLETLDCRVEAAEPITIPDDVWKIPTLTHVHGNGLRCNFDVSHLVQLQTVGSLLLNSCIGKSIPNLIRLRKLNLFIEPEHKEKGDMINDSWKSLQKLPYLKVFCLNLNGYKDIEIACTKEGFPRLLSLKLVNCVLESWVVERGSMPYLEILQLESCPNFVTLPIGLLNRTTLPRLFYTKMDEKFDQWVKSCNVSDATTISGTHPLDVEIQALGVASNIDEGTHPLDVENQALGVASNIDEDHKREIQETKSLISKTEYPSSHEIGVEEIGKLSLLDVESQALGVASNTNEDAKRLIGRRFNDECVQSDRKHWPFKVIAGEADKPYVVVNYMKQEKHFTAEEISSMILFKMKEIASKFMGSPVKKAVVTVPAYFNNSQRQATKDAATIAGLHVLQILNEPTAAALAYSLDNKDNCRGGEKLILVFDLGGGTFDVSLLRLDGHGVVEVKATSGDTHLGGEDFDNRMVDHLLKILREKYKEDLSKYYKCVKKLKAACERAKRMLSTEPVANIYIESLYKGDDFSFDFSEARFVNINEDLFNKCIGLVKQCLEGADVDKKNINEVVLVGGSTRIPKIQELLQKFFEGKKLYNSINVDEAVAYGAAIQAAILNGDKKDPEEPPIALLDVTPLSLGIDISTGVRDIVIPKNTRIPCVMERVYVTAKDNQTSMVFKILEGERTLIDNNLLGEFLVSGIRPAPAREMKCKCTFSMDANGILTVTARNEDNNEEKSLTITRDKFTLRQDDIDRMIREARVYQFHDMERKAAMLRVY